MGNRDKVLSSWPTIYRLGNHFFVNYNTKYCVCPGQRHFTRTNPSQPLDLLHLQNLFKTNTSMSGETHGTLKGSIGVQTMRLTLRASGNSGHEEYIQTGVFVLRDIASNLDMPNIQFRPCKIPSPEARDWIFNVRTSKYCYQDDPNGVIKFCYTQRRMSKFLFYLVNCS